MAPPPRGLTTRLAQLFTTLLPRPGARLLKDQHQSRAMEKSMSKDTAKEQDSITHALSPECEANRAAVRRTAEQVLGRASGRRPASVYWLIASNENGRLEFLVLSLTDSEEVLPVFSSEEEAEMLLGLGQVGFESWQVRRSTAGELISVLYGPRADVKRVALDPSPEMLVERTIGLVSLSREHLADLLVPNALDPGEVKEP
jgi:hypothetical protein